MVYLMSLPGGWLADRIVGQRRAVLYGGILIALASSAWAFTHCRSSILGWCCWFWAPGC